MPLLSAFTRCGHLAMSSAPAHGQRIYESMQRALGPDFADAFDGTRTQAKLYAQAMALACVKYTLERAANQADPMKAWEMLAELEAEWGIIPPRGATLGDRGRALAAKMLLSRGARRENVVAVLLGVLGDDFVDYRTGAPGDEVTWPVAPESVGNFVKPGRVPKVWRLLGSVGKLGAPVTVSIEAVAGAENLVPGETLVVDPSSKVLAENVTVESATSSQLTATFTKAHGSGTLITNQCFPLWTSTQRHSLVVCSSAAAADPEKRRKINERMANLVRDVSTWQICDESGPFKVGVGKLGVTTIGAI